MLSKIEQKKATYLSSDKLMASIFLVVFFSGVLIWYYLKSINNSNKIFSF